MPHLVAADVRRLEPDSPGRIVNFWIRASSRRLLRYPIQVDKTSRPDIDAFEDVMLREECQSLGGWCVPQGGRNRRI